MRESVKMRECFLGYSIIIGPGADNYTLQGLSKGTPQPPIHSHARTQNLNLPSPERLSHEVRPAVFVAGSIAVDFSCDYKPATSASPKQPMLQTSNPAAISQSIGGVGQNVARAIHLLKVPVRLCTMIGDDLAGQMARIALDGAKMDTAGVIEKKASRTSQYVAVNAADKGLVVAMADMEVMEKGNGNKNEISQIFENTWLPELLKYAPKQLVVDGNWSSNMLHKWLNAAKSIPTTTFFEPVSTAKAVRIFQRTEQAELGVWPHNTIDVTTPNSYELQAMHAAARETGYLERDDWWRVVDAFGIPSTGARVQLALATSPQLVDAGIPQQSIQLLPFIPRVLTKLGSEGVLLTQIIPAGDPRLTMGEYAPYIISRCSNDSEEAVKVGGIYMRLLPAAERVLEEEIVSVNGVGDTFLGAIVAGLAKDPSKNIEDLVGPAQQAAVMTLRSAESVSPALSGLEWL
ncbi:Ribokinase-like protein [Myriangium duriaei CBS 260.36]|uniref:Ribokinase-like protein n=1 Tax=Myriangium duriaei CBS 260.36 TaxID=1168546 RepID=A0A9P4J3I6_9PEZI|nr:Ribokinase-like protein [Myriangium duriaei CBS 260.36]